MLRNSMKRRLKAIVGRAELVDIPDAEIFSVPAKIDTGAYRTSVWATDIQEKDGILSYKLLGPSSECYSGKVCTTDKYELLDVENSFGHKEKRYSIHVSMRLGSKKVLTNVTLSDRSKKFYPILIGRKMLRGRYLVDVSEGQPINDEESQE